MRSCFRRNQTTAVSAALPLRRLRPRAAAAPSVLEEFFNSGTAMHNQLRRRHAPKNDRSAMADDERHVAYPQQSPPTHWARHRTSTRILTTDASVATCFHFWHAENAMELGGVSAAVCSKRSMAPQLQPLVMPYGCRCRQSAATHIPAGSIHSQSKAHSTYHHAGARLQSR